MRMLSRRIGSRKFSAIGYGAMGISSAYGSVKSDEERMRVLDRAYELGCTHWDTTATSSDIYKDSEELIGKWFKRCGKRSDIFLATKFAVTAEGIRGDAAYVKEAAARSLKRLGIESIDLYYMHRIDPKVPIEETIGAMSDLVKAGKVKYLGISECSSNTLRRAHAVHPISALQVEYSPFTLDIEDPSIGLLKTARELGVKIVAYSPLGRGLLTGQYVNDFEDTDFRKQIPRYRDIFPKVLQATDDFKAIGCKHGMTAGQVALAWVLAQGDDIIPIPGTKTIKYLEENMAAGNFELSSEKLQDVRDVIIETGLTDTSGRYPPIYAGALLADSPPLNK